MSKSPFYRVSVARSGRDITELITGFSFEDCVDEDDLLTLRLNNVTLGTLEDKDLKAGQDLIFVFGFLGGATSPQHRARITAADPTYEKSINLTIKASDHGVTLKKGDKNKVWTRVKSSDIARKIAAQNGLAAVVDDTTRVWDSQPQANRSDYEFLKYLAGQEKDGGYRVFIKGKTLYFTKINLKKASRRTFTWNNGDGPVLSFRPKESDTSKKAASGKTKAVGTDPYTGKKFEKSAAEGTAKDDVKLGDYAVSFDGNANEKNRSGSAAKSEPAAKTIISPGGDQTSAENLANKTKKAAAMNDVTATLVTEGDPTLLSDEIITVAGVAKRHSGNWYLNKVTHSIQRGSAYTCTSELKKNGSAAASNSSKQKAKDTNKTTGPAAPQSKKPVTVKNYNYNSNAREVK